MRYTLFIGRDTEKKIESDRRSRKCVVVAESIRQSIWRRQRERQTIRLNCLTNDSNRFTPTSVGVVFVFGFDTKSDLVTAIIQIYLQKFNSYRFISVDFSIKNTRMLLRKLTCTSLSLICFDDENIWINGVAIIVI